MYSVLFVCTANICRSPMAMGILRAKISDKKDWTVESAGVWARDGYPVHQYVSLLLKQKDIDLSLYRSRPITREIVNQFNLVLVMEKGHKEGLKAAYPETASKVYLLTEMINQHYEIVDPIGGSLEDFHETAREIEHILDIGFDKLQQLASKRM